MSTIENDQISLYCQELVSIQQHWVKITLEMFVIQHTSILLNFILIVFRIQKK